MYNWVKQAGPVQHRAHLYFDVKQVVVLALLCLFGFVMLASASFDLAQKQYGDAYYYVNKQFIHLLIAFALAAFVYLLPSDFWFRYCTPLLVLTLTLLVLVLLVGVEIKGSQRWLRLPGMGVSFQPSELAKFVVILFTAKYIVRRGHEIRNSFGGLLKPVLAVSLIAFLLLLEPDYGNTVFVFVITTGMLFLAGASLWRFVVYLAGVSSVLLLLAISSSYRLDRILAFLDPWSQYADKGHQLVQSLVAIGSGSWFGEGLGNSMQKQFYLAEVQTDFIFAVIGEELGVVGVGVVILCYLYIVVRCFDMARYIEKQDLLGYAYIAYGIGIWFGVQAFTNIAVAMGALPTKGTTLPLISVGGSSLILFFIAFSVLQRIYHTACCADPGVKRRFLGYVHAP